MVHIYKSDRWSGYASLICAVTVFLVPWVFDLRNHDLAGLAFAICFGTFGLFCALRSLRLGSLPNRICAGVALVFFAWILCEIAIAIFSQAKRA
jgi:hypothetical protein